MVAVGYIVDSSMSRCGKSCDEESRRQIDDVNAIAGCRLLSHDGGHPAAQPIQRKTAGTIDSRHSEHAPRDSPGVGPLPHLVFRLQSPHGAFGARRRRHVLIDRSAQVIAIHTGRAQINQPCGDARDILKEAVQPNLAGVRRRWHRVVDHFAGEIDGTHCPVQIQAVRIRTGGFYLPKRIGARGETAHARTGTQQPLRQAPAGISATDD